MHMQKFVAVFETLKAFLKRFSCFSKFSNSPGDKTLSSRCFNKILTFEPSFLRLSAVIILGSDWLTLIQINIQI